MAYGRIIYNNTNLRRITPPHHQKCSLEITTKNMVSSQVEEHACTLTTAKKSNLLDSDCFNKMEAIDMSKKSRSSKSHTGIYQRGSTWSYTIYPIDVKTGRKKQKWVNGFPSEQAAVESQARARAEILANTYILDSSITLEQYLLDWFNKYKMALQPATIQGYWNNIKLHIIPAIGKTKLSNLNRYMISEFCFEMLKEELSAKTIKYVYSTLRKGLNEAVYDKLISINPCIGAKTPSVEIYDSIVYDEEQVKILLEGLMGSPIETAVMLSVFLGLRRGEALGLRFQDCDFEKNLIHICQQVTTVKSEYGNGPTYGIKPVKTKKSKRTISIPQIIRSSILKQKVLADSMKASQGIYYEDNDLITCNPNGSPKNPGSLLKQFKKLIKSLNLPEIRFHDLRHTCASILLENNAEIKVISDLLGHSTYSTTADIYTNLLSKKRLPAEIMQMKFGSNSR